MCIVEYANSRKCLLENLAYCKELKFYEQEYFLRKNLSNICLSLQEYEHSLNHINRILEELDDHLKPSERFDMLISKQYLAFHLNGDKRHIKNLEQLNIPSRTQMDIYITSKKNYALGNCYMLCQEFKNVRTTFETSLNQMNFTEASINNRLMVKKCILTVIFKTSKPLDCINYFESRMKDVLPRDGYFHIKINVYYISTFAIVH